MADIEIHYYDGLYCKVRAEQGILEEIYENFSFFVPGYKHMPLFKSGRWDGKKRLFNLRTQQFFKSLLPMLISWADRNGHTFHIHDKPLFRPQIKWDKAWLKDLSAYGKMEPHAHQIDYVDAIMERNNCIVLAPTSAGKSYIIYLCIRYILENHPDKRILITVPSTLLCEQLLGDFKDYAVDWNPDEFVQLIYGGQDKSITKNVVISTWQSAIKFPPSWFRQFDFYFCDEAHQANAKSLSTIVENMGHAKMRVGLTGTLDGTKMHELELRGRFGPVVRRVTTRELMDRGLVADLQIECCRLKYSPEEKKAVIAAKDYQKEIDYIVTHKGRNEFIAKKAEKLPGNVLVLFNFVEKHGKPLFELIKRETEDKKECYFISGDVDTDDRVVIKNEMENDSDKVLVASYGTLSQGVSIRNIDWVIFAHPFASRIRNLQSIGRGLRLRKGKTKVGLVDIGDDFTIERKTGTLKENHLYRHFVKRLEIYQSEQFDYDITEVDMA